MYQYDELDRQVVNNRVQQFRGQMSRYLSGELSEEAFTLAVAERSVHSEARPHATGCGALWHVIGRPDEMYG